MAATYFADCHWQIDEAYVTTLALLGRHPQVTALFGCNDESAIGAMRAAKELGWRVPEDVSIVGFDDIDRASHVVPALTTMQVDKMTMGRLAVGMLASRVGFPAAATVTTIIRPRLIERESAAPARAARRLRPGAPRLNLTRAARDAADGSGQARA